MSITTAAPQISPLPESHAFESRPAPARQQVALSVRVGLLLGGASVIGAFVAVLIWNDLGAGPVDVLVVGLSDTTGLSLSVTMMIVFGLTTTVSWSVGFRPGFGTLAAPLVAGYIIEWVIAFLDAFDRPDSLIVRLAIQVIAIGLIGVGAAALMKSNLGAGPSELLTTALAARGNRSEPRVRTFIEVNYLVVGTVLGGPVGVGTAIVGLTIGTAVGNGVRLVDRIVDRAADARPTGQGRSMKPMSWPTGRSARRSGSDRMPARGRTPAVWRSSYGPVAGGQHAGRRAADRSRSRAAARLRTSSVRRGRRLQVGRTRRSTPVLSASTRGRVATSSPCRQGCA